MHFSHKCVVLLSLSQVDLRTVSALQAIKGRVLAILPLLFAHEKALKFIVLEQHSSGKFLDCFIQYWHIPPLKSRKQRQKN